MSQRKLYICDLCGSVVDGRFLNKHAEFHSLLANIMEAIRTLADRSGGEVYTKGSAVIDFEEIK